MKRRFACGLALLCLAGCKLDGFLYSPQRVEAYLLDPQGSGPEDTVSADRIEPLRIEVSAGVSLGAVYVKGNVQPPRGYVLFFHGKSSHLDLEFHRTRRFSNFGYDVLAFDYRGFGASSDVTPTEAGLDADGHAAAQVLRARAGADARIVYWGDSFGTGPAVQRAVADPPGALILEEPYASMQFFVEDTSGMNLSDSFVLDAEWDNEGRIAGVHVPLLQLHGTADTVIDFENSRRIYERANDPKELVPVEGGEHGALHTRLGPRYREVMVGFLEAHLP